MRRASFCLDVLLAGAGDSQCRGTRYFVQMASAISSTSACIIRVIRVPQTLALHGIYAWKAQSFGDANYANEKRIWHWAECKATERLAQSAEECDERRCRAITCVIMSNLCVEMMTQRGIVGGIIA